MLPVKDKEARKETEELKKVIYALLEKENLTVVSGTKRFYLRKKRNK